MALEITTNVLSEDFWHFGSISVQLQGASKMCHTAQSFCYTSLQLVCMYVCVYAIALGQGSQYNQLGQSVFACGQCGWELLTILLIPN